MKKIFSLLLITCLLFQSMAFANEAPIESLKPLSYEDAIKEMLKSHPELESLKKQISIQEEIIKEVKSEANRLKDAILDVEDKIMQRANAVYLDPLKAEITLNTLKRNYDEKVFELKQNLYDFMIRYISKDNQHKLAKTQLEVEEKNHQKIQNELKLGKVTKNDLLASEISLKTAKNNYETAKRDLDIALTEFNYLIHQNLFVTFVPNSASVENQLKGFKVDLATLDLKGLIEKNITSDSALMSYEEDLKKIKAQDKIERIYSSSVSAYKELDKKLEDNAYDTQKRKNTIAYKVYSDYNTLKTLAVDIKIAENNLLLATQNLKAQTVLHQLKRITDLELLKSEKSLTEAENQLREARGTYHKAIQTFLRFY